MKKWIVKTLAIVAMVGLLNWGILGLTRLFGGTGMNVVESLLGSWPLLVNIIYVIAGIAGGIELAELFK